MSTGTHRGSLCIEPQAVKILTSINALPSNDCYHHSDNYGEDRMQGSVV